MLTADNALAEVRLLRTVRRNQYRVDYEVRVDEPPSPPYKVVWRRVGDRLYLDRKVILADAHR